jgi:diguanylate cyclase
VNENLVVLHIGGERKHGDSKPSVDKSSDAEIFRRTLEQAFATMADVLAASDAGNVAEVMAAFERCRTALTADVAAEFVEPIAKSCFESTRGVASQVRNRTAERRAQIAELVAMVRNTVQTITGDQTSLQNTLVGSAERLGKLADSDDLTLIKVRLRQEVSRLTQITMERRAVWEKTVKDFGTRMATLETQLDRTRKEAAIDPLTNVPNRRTFERTCTEWLTPNRRGFVLAMIDVDDFKEINDRYGHLVGDRVLVAVAETLSKCLRADDVVARIGGDEFAVMASSLTLAQAEGRFAGIGRAIQDACRAIVTDEPVPSISVGLAECSAGDTLRSLHERADSALYTAKRGGKGRVASKPAPLIRDLMRQR